jgi:hypothetical protein
MFSADDFLFPPEPFWFVPSKLLANLMCAELDALNQIITEHPDFRKLLDTPEATMAQRKVCFALLANRKFFQMIDEQLVSRYDDSPSLDENQSNALKQTRNLVVADAPPWVLEMNQSVELLPNRILEALPELLQRQGFYTNDLAKDAAIRSAADALSDLEQIQTLSKEVLDRQFERLANRWSATNPVISGPPPVQINQPIHTTVVLNKERRDPNKRKGWQQRLKLYSTIQKVLSKKPSLTGAKFCAELDNRHALPLVDWETSGEWRNGLTWKEAWSNPTLRRRIRRVRQEAMKDR